MITILTRIFPIEISEHIYNFIIQDYVNYILIGKLYTNLLMMEKHFNIYNNIVNPNILYCSKININEIIKICKFLKYTKKYFIDKNHYKYDKYTISSIENFKKFVNFVIKNESHILIKKFMEYMYTQF